MMDMDYRHYGYPGYHKPQGFFSSFFGFGQNEMIGGDLPMETDMQPEGPFGMMRGRGPRDFSPPGFGYDPHVARRAMRDLSPGRAWMAHRGNMPFGDIHDDRMDFHHMEDRFDDFPHPRGMGMDHFGPEPRGLARVSATVDGAIAHENMRRGWQENKPAFPGRRAFDDMYLPSPHVGADQQFVKPKYKFNSPNHLAHVQSKFDFEELHRNRNKNRRRLERYDEDDEPRRRSPERRARRDFERERASSMDDDDNPYHHLPAHIPKDDYDNAMKRNLQAWSQWRSDVNDRNIRGGNVNPRIDSLRRRIVNQRDPDDNGFRLNDPAVLMNYASNNENTSPLNRDVFLKYGLPRVKGDGAEDMRGLHEGRPRGRQSRRY